MMLRSSSTPILGSLLSSFAESPSSVHHPSEFHGSTPKHTATSVHQSRTLFARAASKNFIKYLVHSPSIPVNKATADSISDNGFRKVQSEANLGELTDTSCSADDLGFSNRCFKKVDRKHSHRALEAIPSFSFRRTGTRHCEDEDSYDEDNEEEFEMRGNGNTLEVRNLVLQERGISLSDYETMKTEGGQGKMYLAAGLGVSDSCFLDGGGHGGIGGSGGSYRPVDFYRDGGDSRELSMEAYYKRMLEENPGNPLFLRNYAQFLYHSKGDLFGAEEYYSRAILADPEDGELLSQYAQLIWESQQDKDRAVSYFERAIQASSENSHIQAAYASFLWDMEDGDENEDNGAENSHLRQLLFQQGTMSSATA